METRREKLIYAMESAQQEQVAITARLLDLEEKFPAPAPEPIAAVKKLLAAAEVSWAAARHWADMELRKEP